MDEYCAPFGDTEFWVKTPLVSSKTLKKLAQDNVQVAIGDTYGQVDDIGPEVHATPRAPRSKLSTRSPA